MRCVQKLSVLCSLVEGREEEREEQKGVGKNVVPRAISAHSDWLGGCLAESHYRQGMGGSQKACSITDLRTLCIAWLEYCHGDYQEALLTLSSSRPPSHLSPLFHLLSGACYAKQVLKREQFQITVGAVCRQSQSWLCFAGRNVWRLATPLDMPTSCQPCRTVHWCTVRVGTQLQPQLQGRWR